MKRLLLYVLIFISCAVFADNRTVIFTDSNGVTHAFELSNSASISTFRVDGSVEASIRYKNGTLEHVSTALPDGSDEAGIFYQHGILDAVAIPHPDGRRIKHGIRRWHAGVCVPGPSQRRYRAEHTAPDAGWGGDNQHHRAR